MDKQATIGFVLIGVILTVWLYMNSPQPQQPVKQLPDSTQVANQQPDTLKKEEAESPKEENIAKETEEVVETGAFAASKEPEKIVTVETDLVKMELTNKGARLRKIYLKNYNTWYYNDIEDTSDFYNRHVQLINQSKGGELGVIFVTQEGQLVNTSKLSFDLDRSGYNFKVAGNDSLQLTYKYRTADNQEIKRTYLIRGNDYMLKTDVEMVNMNRVISGLRYDVVWESGLNFVEDNSFDEAQYSNASAFSGGEQVVIDASSADDIEEKDLNGLVDWVGIRNKYFCFIISNLTPNEEGGAKFEGHRTENKSNGDVREYYSASVKVPFKGTNYQKDSFDLYLGPIDYYGLKKYEKNYESIYDFGSFLGLKFITRPISEYILLPLFRFLHGFIPNYGFVIILFSIIIKLALYPLTKQSYKSMGRMQKLQPKIAELKEKYGNDPQRVQKETMKLYSTYGINPAGGCLPMLLQMPILFALFTFFRVTVDIRHEPFLFWITNLSSPDYIMQLPFKIPLIGVDKITGLAPLLGITMFIQQKMTVKDPNQKAMIYMMPVMFTFMFMGFSSGLNLYYFMFNLLTIAQQYYMNHKGGDMELVAVPKKERKTGFMQRMMEAAEQQQKSQQNPKKKRKF